MSTLSCHFHDRAVSHCAPVVHTQCCCFAAAAFEVESADAMEARLVFYGIEYTKAVVPDTDASQLFFFDPAG